MYTFDGTNRIISIDLGVTTFQASDLYSRWKEWVATNDNGKFPRAFTTVGGEPIDSAETQFISPYYFLTNGWKVRPQEADHELVIDGNLLTDDGSNTTVATIGDFDVFVRTVLSANATTTVINNGSGLDEEQAAALDYLVRWAKADEEKNVPLNKYFRRDEDTGEVLLEKDYTKGIDGTENLTKP